jgi:hypothetical protein
MSGHRPLLVTAKLSTPISCERPIPFEGILYDVRFRDDPATMGTPLESLTYRDGVPLASVGIILVDGLGGADFGSEPVLKSVNLRTRSVDSIGLPEKRASALTKIGAMSPYRNQIRSYPTMSGVAAVSWLAVGEAAAVSRAVNRVPGIGALRNRGFGEVAEWSVDEADFDPDLTWFTADGIMRRLSMETVVGRFGSLPEGAVVGQMRVEPPLWVRAETIDVASPSLKSMTMTSRELRTLLA